MERQDCANSDLEASGRGRRMVRQLNIDGDGQADLAGHGGEQRAVVVYQMESHQ
jgi:MOSC domain-containing protein YiiM